MKIEFELFFYKTRRFFRVKENKSEMFCNIFKQEFQFFGCDPSKGVRYLLYEIAVFLTLQIKLIKNVVNSPISSIK